MILLREMRGLSPYYNHKHFWELIESEWLAEDIWEGTYYCANCDTTRRHRVDIDDPESPTNGWSWYG